MILRHDIDKLPANALEMAQLEHDLGVTGFYYFRVKPGLWNAGVMGKITELGHEPGYHYEYPAIAKGDLSNGIRMDGQSFSRSPFPDNELQMSVKIHFLVYHPYDIDALPKSAFALGERTRAFIKRRTFSYRQ